jgi:hypothetical protein
MAFYFFYQAEPKSVWIPALADERSNTIRTKKPALTTVLDVDSTFEEDMSAEQHAAVRYRGPLYWDIDSADLESAIEQAKKLLVLIQSMGVDLNMLRCYLSGGRGVHILMDQAIFMPKIPSNGTPHLPNIYREMVWSSLFVDDVDMRVYSSRKGRMLRCANYLRENGLYKVSVTADEIFSLTPERYSGLCASPRNEVPVEAPRFCPELGLAFSVAQDKVVKAAARRKTKKAQCDDLKKFGGDWPETLQLVINGVGLREEVGFNQVAMQVAITATALGMTEDRVIEDCSGLIETHKGDSSRYGTPARRRAFLKEMFRYVDSNPLYDFSAGGVLSLLIPEVRANSDLTFGEFVPDADPVVKPKKPKVKPAKPTDGEAESTTTEAETTTGSDEPEEDAEDEDDEPDDGGRIQMSRSGTFFKTEDGYKNVCDLGFFRPISMRKLNGEHIGYEVDTYLDGKDIGKKFIPMNAFASKGQFNNWSLGQGASMRASDLQTSSLSDYFRKRSTKSQVYAVEREGIDVIVPPGAKTGDEVDVIWASPEGVVTFNEKINYRYHGIYNAQGTYKSDLMTADPLSKDDEEFIRRLLDINTTTNVAKLIGWFSAAFLTQLIRKKFKRFPSMQIFGQAGAGKSMSVILMNHMHYNLVEPRQFSVAGQTMFPIIVAVATSASLPLVFEEVKARQLSKTSKDFLQNILRSNYTADQLQRGSLGRDKTVREPTVTDFANAAPIVFVGEAIEDQSAILERCVIVALSKSDQRGKEANFDYCMDRATQMGKLGRRLAELALKIDRDLLNAEVTKNFKEVSGLAQAAMIDGASRPAFNLAVVLTGLEFLRFGLSEVFGTTFDERIEGMKQSILGNITDNIPKNMAEASRVLDVMALLSRHEDPNVRLVGNVDYTISPDEQYLDLKLRNAYAKYVKYQRSLGMEVLFDHENAFVTALANYGGTVKKACPENIALYDSPRAVIYRLSLDYLDREGVDRFSEKCK